MASTQSGFVVVPGGGVAVDGSGDVYYVDPGQTIHEMFWNGTQFVDANLMASSQSGLQVSVAFKISGEVDAGFGVTVTLTGTRSDTTATDGNGSYTFLVPAQGSYTVTPSLTNFTFNPLSQSFVNLGSNWTANFASSTSGGTPSLPGVVPPPTPTLSNYVATAASSGIIYAPHSQNQAVFICYLPPYDTPVEGCDVELSTGYYSESNAHLHESSSHP